MRLERLEINGFKSFSDRSELAFDKGVTAIVGPNGCGKSNVADAITWVMGEQSAKSLRGDKMEDVIFSGSDARKPTATAEVRLRFSGFLKTVSGPAFPIEQSNGGEDAIGNGHGRGHTSGNGSGHNGDGPHANAHDHGDERLPVVSGLSRTGAEAVIQSVAREIEVTRRLYRSGESEYLIDGQVCRLRDVHDLLMDTGLGAKAYSVIEQGMIGIILSSRSADRRQLIEEAAGVTKYKARRRSAELKLQAAQLNLTRIDDIAFEVERQRGTLKRQAGKARRYQRLRDELRRWEKVLFARKYRQLAATIASARARLTNAREREAAAAARVGEMDADLGRLRIELVEAESASTESRNAATALGHALEHAAAARDRVAETLSKLDVEVSDVRIESERVAAERGTVVKGLRRAHESIAATCIARSARESELASARIEHEWRARSVRAREHELAGLDARLKSLVELDAARAGYGDAARTVLVQADGKVSPQGAIADYLEVEAGYERAVEACLGDLLEHVVVERPEHAAAGFHLVREAGAGRCGFLVTSAAPTPVVADVHTPMSVSRDVSGVPPSLASTIPMLEGIVALSSVVRVNGPFAGAIRRAAGDAWIARSYDGAAVASQLTGLAVATLEGDVFRGPHLVSGGGSAEARGILATKGEIKELRQRIAADREALLRLAQDTAELEATIAHASNAIAALNAEHHRQEKAVVGYDAQLQHAADEEARLAQKSEQLAREKRQAEEERDTLDRRQEEARASIARLEEAQRHADQRLTFAQRRLFEAREAAEDLSHRAADAGAALAALVERASALSSEVQRLEEAALELDERSAALSAELDEAKHRVRELHAAIASGRLQLDADERALDALRQAVMARDDVVGALRTRTDELEASIKDARVALDAIRAVVSEADVARATAEADLSHLGHTCEDAVNATLDDVVAEIDQLEREGHAVPDADVVFAEEPDEDRVDTERSPVVGPADDWRQAAGASAKPAPSAEEAVSALRAKIDRVGPANMMAIGEFEELEARHTFLTAQRKDLVDSIAQTSEAIERIDETTTARFTEAFSAINENFQHTFSTLFGGGRAGLTLLDENDPLESGIEIVAQPPGKRLQSVQLLSGGEKALTAIALMFGMFKYKPSPFCLLDEIDAPLDDANIGRFVEMLRGMQEHTQFIVITHNRKTMEIADRLYGVTMEEPGVSKLISVQLN